MYDTGTSYHHTKNRTYSAIHFRHLEFAPYAIPRKHYSISHSASVRPSFDQFIQNEPLFIDLSVQKCVNTVLYVNIRGLVPLDGVGGCHVVGGVV